MCVMNKNAAVFAAVTVCCLTVLSACTGGGSSTTPQTTSSDTQAVETHVGFKATVVQQRLDVGTRRIGLELTSDAGTTAHVSAVQLMTESFTQQPSTPKDTDFTPGRIIDLVVLYGDPVCRAGVSPDDATVQVQYDADGRSGTLTLPVDHHGVRVLNELRDAYCAEQRLKRAASLRYELPFHRERVDGATALVGDLVLERPADGGSGRPVAVHSLLGSVILDLQPPAPRAATWGSLPRGQTTTRVPIVLKAGRTCTAHGRSGTQQPFIFSAYVTVGGAPLYRQIIEPPRQLQRQALAYLDDVCG
jgi:hypothetical protein